MWRLMMAFSVLILATATARAEIAPDPDWSEAETWAWARVAAGKVADFDTQCPTAPGIAHPDDPAWASPCRTLRGSTIEQMLTHQPWRDAIPHSGLIIAGAHVVGGVDLTNAQVGPAVVVARSVIDGDIVLIRARLTNLFALDGSMLNGSIQARAAIAENDLSFSDGRQFPALSPIAGFTAKGSVALRNARLHGSLFLNGAHFGSNVDVRGAIVDGEFSTSGAEFGPNAPLQAGSLHIAGKLSLNATVFKGDVHLTDAVTGSPADLNESIFSHGLTVDYAHIGGDLHLDRMRAAGQVSLANLQLAGRLWLPGVVVAGSFDAPSAKIASDVKTDEKTHLGSLTLDGASIGGTLDLAAQQFGGPAGCHGPSCKAVSLRGTHVSGDAVLDGIGLPPGALLDIRSLSVDGDLSMTWARLGGDTEAGNINVKHDLTLSDATFAGAVHLFDASVGNAVHAERAAFQQKLSAPYLRSTSDVILSAATLNDTATLVDARIGGDLNLEGAHVAGLDLSRATVSGALMVDGNTTWPPSPSNAVQFSLAHATIGALQDGPVGADAPCPSDPQPPPPNGWPNGKVLALEGLVYGHLGASEGAGGANARDRDVCWWLWWVKRNNEFSTQPYVQLAAVMAAHGDQDNASAIQFYGRVDERENAWATGHVGHWFLLLMLEYVAGFGIGVYTFRVIAWVALLTIGGSWLLKHAPGGQTKPLLWRAGASLTRVLPIIEINREFTDFFNDPDRQRLTGKQVVVFSAVVILGWILGLFLAAALSGLTQHS